MFKFFEGASLKFAMQLIQVTRVQESMAVIREKNLSQIGPEDLFKLTLALNACNLEQTMREDFIQKEIDPDDGQDIVDDYVVQNLRFQDWIPIRDGAERMEKCDEILETALKLGVHWDPSTVSKGADPRYLCVKDVLRRLGNEGNTALHHALLEFVNLHHKHFLHFFHVLLEPFQAEARSVAPVNEDPATEPVHF